MRERPVYRVGRRRIEHPGACRTREESTRIPMAVERSTLTARLPHGGSVGKGGASRMVGSRMPLTPPDPLRHILDALRDVQARLQALAEEEPQDPIVRAAAETVSVAARLVQTIADRRAPPP
jgi:hypothetical protein